MVPSRPVRSPQSKVTAASATGASCKCDYCAESQKIWARAWAYAARELVLDAVLAKTAVAR